MFDVVLIPARNKSYNKGVWELIAQVYGLLWLVHNTNSMSSERYKNNVNQITTIHISNCQSIALLSVHRVTNGAKGWGPQTNKDPKEY